MKLSKEQKAKAIREYEVYFDSYINGDVKTIVSMLDENYNQIGSAEAEVFYNKNEAVNFLKDTINQVAGKTEIRNRFIKLDPLEKYILITDLFDIYVLIENEWSFYSRFRASTLMLKKEDGWKFIHQHSSVPDTRTEDGDNIAIEKITAENLQLRDAVKRRTVELENKSRDLEIEAAMERVRTEAMSMQKPNDMLDVCQIISEQLEMLNVINIRNVQVAIIDEPKKIYANYQFFTPYRKKIFEETAYENNPASFAMVTEMQKSANSFFIGSIKDNELQEFKEWRKKYNQFPDPLLDKSSAVFYYFYSIGKGGLGLTTYQEISNESLEIFKRFHNVFKLAYRRFVDIEKAEVQAREAQIELSLERIRAQVTAMKESSDLLDIVVTMRTEFVALGHEAQYFWYMRWLPEIYEKAMTSGDGARIGMVMSLPRHIHGDIKLVDDWEKRDEPSLVFAMDVDTAVDYIDKMITLGDFKQVDPNAPTLDDIRHIGGLTFVMARTTHGEIGYSLPGVVSNPPEKDLNTLVRYAGVFDLAYRRFEDLKLAEQQNWETQIELALERVRAKTMAMHNSHDMGITVETLFDQVLKLGLDNDIRCGIGILKGKERMETRSATLGPNGEVDLRIGMLDMTIHPMLKRIKKAWKNGGTHFKDQMAGKDVIRYYTALNNEPDYPFYVDLNTLPKKEFHNSFSFLEGILFAFSPNSMSEEAAKVMGRFARVFGQTYTRYVDLQKAEAQAREAQIEAALERIRAQAMAMQHSNDLIKSTSILFEELEKLELSLERCGIGIFDKETRDCQLYTTVVNDEGKTELATGITSLTVHPMLIKTFDAWKVQESLFYVLEGKELEDYYKLVSKSKFHLPEDVINKSASLAKEYYFYMPFGAGGLYVFSDIEPTIEETKVIRRFAEVFHMTYTRYEDLQKAEARALEAIKQSSLDRVRGEIASMRSTDDLQRITPLIWKELETLGVPFNRCGVFIVDESASIVRVYLTTNDGIPLGVLNLPTDGNELTRTIMENWRNQEVYAIHWDKIDFIAWMQSMIKLGQVQSKIEYQGNVAPPEKLDLHFIPFAQGLLYVGHSDALTEDKIDLVKSLARAFEVAYARYEDFKQLEDAKHRVDQTLSELKSTQSQLIHAEKMASLGELTAGIAHEIQNPLNFVNNFADVSVDLIEEMGEEITLGNNEEVKNITSDLKQNLEKIHHHGKRASFIVQGMLEHSRTNPGDKKPTDINILADEFLRLSYHGLRAKDKSFNAEIITEFDKDLPEINVISQDFGRVLLNLVNNAFYACAERSRSAVAEKQKVQTEAYKPTVLLSTKKIGDIIEIRVKDNGNGIPDNVLKKIFQPFFTTKPTGEGTGLGLSMSYDIITKGHDGKLSVETSMDEGTTFIIQLQV